MFHRPHLPGGYFQSRVMPILLDPVGNLRPFLTAIGPRGLPSICSEHFGFEIEADDGRVPELLEFLAPDPVDHEDCEAAYSRVFGPIRSVLHEMMPGPDHIDVYSFQWPEPRHEHGYVSGGMSNLLQPDGGDFSRIELVFYSKHPDPRFARLIQVLPATRGRLVPR